MNQFPVLVTVTLVSYLLGCASESDITESLTDSSAAKSSVQSRDLEPSPEIIEKRIEYRDAMRRVVSILEGRYLQGIDSITPLAEANVELAEAELAAAVSQEERDAALEKMLGHAIKREDYARITMETGAGRTDNLAMATAGRLKVELMLLEEKQRLATPVSPEDTD
ncbi:hypothetical protein [Roseiconus lacunae]|uniref:hypothetical protein n=1 Tax=Roseiconus lacunae TaxID=2605694 RepID=UPI001E5EA135|nr:hypothetical protein [Roseiconus lacunae]MCD0463358.1 hypothetical protein [Roseiconus lacunae]